MVTIALIVVSAILAVLVAGGLVVYVRLIKRYRRLETAVTLLAQGTLTERTECGGSDALGQLCARYDDGIDNLVGILRRVQESAQASETTANKLALEIQKTIASAATISSQAGSTARETAHLADHVADGSAAVEQILATITSLTQRIESQASAVGETSAAIEEMSASIQSVATIASDKRESTEELVALTSSGNEKVRRTDEFIGNVRSIVDDILGAIGVINGIAAQTNLLAMNAAIEAAHAGDAGRGFAVVADEIRNLSESTAGNAKKISRTLKELVDQIKQAGEWSSESGEAFEQINAGVRTVSDAFSEITESTRELSQGARDVLGSTSALKNLSEEIRGSAGEMQIGAQEINTTLNRTTEIARDVDGSVGKIYDASKDVNGAAGRIADAGLDNATELERLAQHLQAFEYDETNVSEAQTTERKIRYSNLILRHTAWVSRVRALIDGRDDVDAATLIDHRTSDLGRWLEGEGKEIITEPAEYEKLYNVHHDLHGKVRGIAECIRDDGCEDVEPLFGELIAFSKQVVEILTTQGSDEFIEWTPDLSVEVETFDQQHKRLIALINKLYHAMRDGKGDELLDQTLDELLAYTGYHFGTEERVFEMYKYPQCEAHRQQHGELIARTTQLKSDFESGKPVLTTEVMKFLQDWVVNHIKRCDRLYTPYLKNKQITA